MQFRNSKKVIAFSLIFSGLGSAAVAATNQPMPASMEEMWKIIQQQQQEIAELKAKAAKQEATQAEIVQRQHGPQVAAGGTKPASAGKNAVKTEAERKTDILASEVEKLKTQLFIPESREYKSQFGLGPAASEVYRVNRGLSIGGYGEAFYTNYTADKGDRKDQFDLARAVLYAGYKFNDWIVLNNEIEFEHGTTGEGDEEKGEVSVEFSQLDFFLHPKANIRAGLMLVPMGFINEIHEPVTFHGNRRPEVERTIIPTTWRELGAGLFGEIVPGLQYRMYAINGLRANPKFDEGFESSGIREGRQGGSQAVAEDFAFTGRLDYVPGFAPGVLMGASTFLGNSGQGDRFLGKKADVFTQLYEGHLQWHYRGLEFRALGAWGHIDDAALVSAQKTLEARAEGEDDVVVGEENYGWYVETAYDVMPLVWKDSTQYLAPFFRYERFDTIAKAPSGFRDDGLYDREIFQAGLTYKPIQNVVIKADYRNIDSRKGQQPDEFNLGLGFIY